MNSSITTQTIKTTKHKMPAFETFITIAVLFLFSVSNVKGQNYNVWVGDPALFELSNSDAGGKTAIEDFPLLDQVRPSDYELTLTPDKKYYILTKIKGYRELTVIENVRDISMQYLGSKENPGGEIRNINNDTITFLKNYNDIAHFFPAEKFDKIIPVIKDRLYTLLTGIQDYRISSRCKNCRIRTTKIVTEGFIIKLKFDKKGNLVRMKKRDKVKQSNEQAYNLNKADYILYARNLSTNKELMKKHFGILSLAITNIALAINDSPNIEY